MPWNLYGECLPRVNATRGLIAKGNYEVSVSPSVDVPRDLIAQILIFFQFLSNLNFLNFLQNGKALLLNVKKKKIIVIELYQPIDHFTVSCSVVWPLNESEARGDLVLIESSLLFSC